jgi:hypothetical protein
MLYSHSFSTLLEYTIRKVQINQDSLKVNSTHQLLVYADDDFNILGGSLHTTKKQSLVVARTQIGLYVNADKTNVVISRDLNAGRSHNIKGDSSCAWLEGSKYLGTTLTNQNYIQEEIRSRLKSGNVSYHLVHNILSFSLLIKNINI